MERNNEKGREAFCISLYSNVTTVKYTYVCIVYVYFFCVLCMCSPLHGQIEKSPSPLQWTDRGIYVQ